MILGMIVLETWTSLLRFLKFLPYPQTLTSSHLHFLLLFIFTFSSVHAHDVLPNLP